jgi:hypothetical protein
MAAANCESEASDAVIEVVGHLACMSPLPPEHALVVAPEQRDENPLAPLAAPQRLLAGPRERAPSWSGMNGKAFHHSAERQGRSTIVPRA